VSGRSVGEPRSVVGCQVNPSICNQPCRRPARCPLASPLSTANGPAGARALILNQAPGLANGTNPTR
jgi:hypothetical protein